MRRPPVALVDGKNCNGCGRCVADCPYLAVALRATERRSQPRLAVVDARACASCGICAGACPSSTPFRSLADLTTGIDLPQARLSRLRAELDATLARWAVAPGRGVARIVAFGCSPALARCADDATATFALRCIAQLPPSFIEYALRAAADGVLLAGCWRGDCEFRLGDSLTIDRLGLAREPHLRAIVPRERLLLAWIGDDASLLERALARLRSSLAEGARPAGPPPRRMEGSHVGMH